MMDETFLWLQFVLEPQKKNMPKVQNWQALYDFAVKQQIIGVCSPTPYSIKVDSDVLFQWIGDEQQIRQQNELLNMRIKGLSSILEGAGFRFCILKGQGNAEMYLDPGVRCAGDIDVWIDGSEKSVIDFVRGKFPEIKQTFKHIKFPVFDDVEVDVHTTPLKLYHPVHKKALKKWITAHKKEQFSNRLQLSNVDVSVNVPTARFNVIYQMGHMLIHLLDEGIGMRHFVDYYYVLQKLGRQTEIDKLKIVNEWDSLGMLRLASGVMWVEKEILGIPDELLICEPNSQRGKILLSEILDGGNFGHHHSIHQLRNSFFIYRFSKSAHLLKIITLFPGEASFRLLHKGMVVIKHFIGR